MTLARSYSTYKKRLLGRYKTLPIDLFRFQGGLNVKLREFNQQKSLGRTSFDLKVGPNGLVHPSDGEFFKGHFLFPFFLKFFVVNF
jgi:hypothetical protein